jgi:hypothetical protein
MMIISANPTCLRRIFSKNISIKLNLFRQANDGRLSHLELITMAKGVAVGMEYLVTMKFVHRVRIRALDNRYITQINYLLFRFIYIFPSLFNLAFLFSLSPFLIT